jgi:hypothetical protein
MNTITAPIGFTNALEMNKWYDIFQSKSIEICKKYSVIELWERAVIYKDENTFQVAIVSLGSWISNSNTERAAKEILKTFESMC